ncbi:MAG: polysaccharide biosynthesis tyrosine autokinase [Acidobacteria bacterium]|nr:polysaccharide biosynthesis tyrosine autokinase [Acidobacteriota bacterium]MBU4306685.1 polysaccharide biosynthesis tyrosine autokinase [Acidobacteriota bacterium]MBU4404694.1 polysaccharide biosynthesis tyrosine autokinase [Acidobacteriota bacterium]MCG2812905.1 polysaccharide biosynthesis tyrosine autokinase [Candidatus Aminicenantes bacterium]
MANPTENQDLLLEEGIQFHEIWELIKKRRMIVYYFAGFVLLAALIRVQLQTPLFMARGTLLIEKEGRGQMNLLSQNYYEPDWANEYLNTQIRVLTSRSLAKKVIGELERLPGQESRKPAAKPGSLQKILGSNQKDPDPEQQLAGAASGFLGGLGVSNIPDTRLLEVSYVSPDPKMAAHAVNTLFDKFIEFNLEMKAESTKQAAEFLTAQIEEMRRNLAQKEQELQEYGKRKELYYIRGEDSTVVQKLSDLNSAYTAAQIERINKEAVFRELKGKPFDNYPDVRVNSLIQGLKQEFSTRESEIKKKSQIFQESYPEMQRLRSQQEGLQKRINSETADIARKSLNQAEAEYQAALKKENYLMELLNQQKGSVVSSNADAIYYNSLKIEVQNMTNLLDFLTRKQKESMLSSRLDGLQTSNIKIVDRAEIPTRAFSPNKQRTLLLALMLGLGGGIFLIFALNYLDNTVKSPEEVEKLLHLPALGFIPAVGAKPGQSYYQHYYSDRKKQQSEQKLKAVEFVNLNDPESTFAEHYRNIRTSLLLSTPAAPPKVMVVTSALPQEGKTVTVVNLAVAFTQLGKKVLIIDCDLRRPRLHKIFRIKNLAGVTSFLVGRSRLEDILYRYPNEPNLHVIPSGPIPPNPVELIISKGLGEMMAKLRQHYDFIFIDAPPLMGISDAILLGEHADGLLLVAWGGKTPRKVIEKAKNEIEKYNVKLFGLILNKVNMRRFAYAYSSYNYKYGAYREDDEKRGEA